jgi:hypothetical protein
LEQRKRKERGKQGKEGEGWVKNGKRTPLLVAVVIAVHCVVGECGRSAVIQLPQFFQYRGTSKSEHRRTRRQHILAVSKCFVAKRSSSSSSFSSSFFLQISLNFVFFFSFFSSINSGQVWYEEKVQVRGFEVIFTYEIEGDEGTNNTTKKDKLIFEVMTLIWETLPVQREEKELPF